MVRLLRERGNKNLKNRERKNNKIKGKNGNACYTLSSFEFHHKWKVAL